MAERFFSPTAAADTPDFTLDGDEARHLARVRRVRKGELVELFDGQGFAISAEVVAVLKDRVQLRQAGPPLPDRTAPISLTLATAVPKGDRFDWLVEKATELGVDRLVPLVTERSAVDPRFAKLDRLRRNVIEASKQCGRNRLMRIEPTIPWTDFLRTQVENALVCHPSGSHLPVRWKTSKTLDACVTIGPEGGFTEEEVDAARAVGWGIVSLGETLLRIETAGIVACVRALAMADHMTTSEKDVQ